MYAIRSYYGQRLERAGLIGHFEAVVVSEELGAGAVVAQVGSEAEPGVGLDGVGPLVLQAIRADLVEQADAPPLLAQVEQNALAGLGDPFQRLLQLKATVTAQAEQRIAGQALGMDTGQYRLVVV